MGYVTAVHSFLLRYICGQSCCCYQQSDIDSAIVFQIPRRDYGIVSLAYRTIAWSDRQLESRIAVLSLA